MVGVLVEVVFEVVVEVCLFFKTQVPIYVQSIITAWKSKFKKPGKVMSEDQRLEKTET